MENIDEKFSDILKDHTAGDPTDESILRTNLTQKEIAKLMFEKYDIRVSKTVIAKLLKKHNYKRRKLRKKDTMKEVGDRDRQFENIAHIRSEYEKENLPIISMDTKKKNI